MWAGASGLCTLGNASLLSVFFSLCLWADYYENAGWRLMSFGCLCMYSMCLCAWWSRTARFLETCPIRTNSRLRIAARPMTPERFFPKTLPELESVVSVFWGKCPNGWCRKASRAARPYWRLESRFSLLSLAKIVWTLEGGLCIFASQH